jgi:chromosome partitioning protein
VTSSNLGWPADAESTADPQHLGWAEIVYGDLDEPKVEGHVHLSSGPSGSSSEKGVETAPAPDQGRLGAAEEDTIEDVRSSGGEGGKPVDNSGDKNPIGGGFVRDNTAHGVGDKGVDELPPPDDVSRETDERSELAAVLPTSGGDTPVLQELAENARRRIQLRGRKLPKPTVPRVLTVANQKGGVGKTTTAVNVAAAMAQAGLQVLVVDLDPQGNASTALGIDHHADVVSIYDVLVDGTPLMDVIQPCTTIEGLFCAPATIDLAGAEIELVSLVARETRLQKAIDAANEKGHEFDYILIDCPPSLGLLTVNAMVAATEVFIPIQCEYYALEGLSQLLKNIELVRAHLNPALHVSTILLTMYDGRTRLSAQVADEVREHFPSEVLRTTVPRSVRVSEAPSFGETVMTYDPNSSGALSYLEAASEIAERGAAGRT